jgi:hypothetical protein
MVSGHTITKPTINLSRVNMQRLQNVNLSIIEEGPPTPERTLERSIVSLIYLYSRYFFGFIRFITTLYLTLIF